MDDAKYKTASALLAGLTPAARMLLEQADGRTQGSSVKGAGDRIPDSVRAELSKSGVVTATGRLTMRGEIVAEMLFRSLTEWMDS
jgi:hypothetical protein